MKKLLSAIAVAATFLIGSMSGAMAACSGPAVMHDFANTAFNMSLITAQDGNCASNVGLNTSTAGALVAGVAVDGWNVTLGTKADAAWVSGSGSVVAILKNIAAGVAGSVPVTVNGTPTALTGLTPAVAQTGTIVAANMDLTSVGGTAIGAMANFGTTPGAVKVQGVNASLFMGTAAISATNGSYSNLLQGNAVISATNGIYANVLQGNAALSATNGSFTNILQGNVALSVTNPSFTEVTDGSHGAANTKAASTPAVATDIALVVDQRPSGNTAASVAPVKGSVPVAAVNVANTVAASATNFVLSATQGGASGATGDLLEYCVIQPGTTSPGAFTILDNATTIFSFPGGGSSVSNLVPFVIPVGALSISGAWKITTTTNITGTCYGKFT